MDRIQSHFHCFEELKHMLWNGNFWLGFCIVIIILMLWSLFQFKGVLTGHSLLWKRWNFPKSSASLPSNISLANITTSLMPACGMSMLASKLLKLWTPVWPICHPDQVQNILKQEVALECRNHTLVHSSKEVMLSGTNTQFIFWQLIIKIKKMARNTIYSYEYFECKALSCIILFWS